MVSLIAHDRMQYGKKTVRRGERFEASDKDAKVLVGAELAHLESAPAPTQRGELFNRAQKAEGDTSEPAGKRGKRYRRADLRAED